jgi:hypothetical protein
MGSGQRPSRSKGRMRMRSTVLVSRADGRVESGLRLAGEDFTPMPDGEGMVLDAIRRALHLPTPPPEVRFTEWLARMLFLLVIGDGGRQRHVGWAQLRPALERYEDLGNRGTWEVLRKLASRGRRVASDLSPDVAAWMDEGMFARWVLGELPPYELLLEDARRAATPEAFTQVCRLLRKWGLRTRLRRAA